MLGKMLCFLNSISGNIASSWISYNEKISTEVQNKKWKNNKAPPGCAYIPSEIERIANVITHGVCIIPVIYAGSTLFNRSRTSRQMIVAYVYGTALILLFTISTFFHCSFYLNRNRSIKNILHRCDRAMIYVFIAASYFPWLQMENKEQPHLVATMHWIIWLLAILGIIYQQIFHERYKCLETCFYTAIAVGPLMIILLSGHEIDKPIELIMGGIIYIIGIFFFKSDGIIPMAHSIWHVFVAIAASIHYYAVLQNFYPS